MRVKDCEEGDDKFKRENSISGSNFHDQVLVRFSD